MMKSEGLHCQFWPLRKAMDSRIVLIAIRRHDQAVSTVESGKEVREDDAKRGENWSIHASNCIKRIIGAKVVHDDCTRDRR